MLLLSIVSLKIALHGDDAATTAIAWWLLAHRALMLGITAAPTWMLAASTREMLHVVVSMVVGWAYLPQLVRYALYGNTT